MLTLDMILTENRATSRDEAYVAHAAKCSPFITRLLSKDPALMQDLIKNLHQAYRTEDMLMLISDQNIFDESSLKRTLRQLRQLVMARMISRDLNGLADFYEVVATTSALAEITIKQAIAFHTRQLQTRFGLPKDTEGNTQELIVVGMGKLGGYELNVSSDIDLIFAYEQEGQTDGAEVISNQDFFTRLGKKIISALDDTTEDGFVFRVDMRLRPFGSEGALVCSLDAMEDYYQNYGREWERYAWIKGRVVAGPSQALTQVLKPFVFRKYLDFNAYASMRDLKVQIQRDVAQRGLDDNIKLGRGGIREVEFIAQLFQLIRGGQDADLQIKPTLAVLALLQQQGVLSTEAVSALSNGYIYLRNIEHRLMYIDDQQTQDLPKSEANQQRLITMTGHANWDAFLTELNQHRAIIQAHFDATFSDAEQQDFAEETALWRGALSAEVAHHTLSNLGYDDVQETYARIQRLSASSRYQQLPTQSKLRFDQLMPIVIHQAVLTHYADDAFLRTINLLETICRRASYLALLAEFPEALKLLVNLCAVSPWLAQYLSAHPILLDELLDTQTLYTEPDIAELRKELCKKMQQCEGDTEAQMDAMRHFKHVAVLRLAAQDVMGNLSLERLSDHLSDLAQLILQVTLQTIWQSLKFKHRDVPQFAIIGYGKLGGKELGYMSDLDIIFLYDDDQAGAVDVYARFAQRINTWFNSITNAGLLYETDMQLRPDSSSGMLVSSLDAFKDYQLHKAWVWEHQALTRARFVAGDTRIEQPFEAIRKAVMTQPRNRLALKQEVLSMREKMRVTHQSKPEVFDVKFDRGGIVDVEFMVQYLLLSYAHLHDELSGNIGNIALLNLLGRLGYIPSTLASKVADAYRTYRKVIHTSKLQGHTSKVAVSELRSEREAVIALWYNVFNEVVNALSD